MSRGIKLVLMGVAGAALLYSCAPGIGAGLGALPYLWFFPILSIAAPRGLRARRHRQPAPVGDDSPDASKAVAASTRASAAASADGQRRAARPGRAEHAPRSRDAAARLADTSSSSSASTTTSWTARPTGPSRPATPSSSDEIDQLEAATEELHGLCLKAVEHVVANKLWERMRIPPAWGDYIERVWRRADPTICGRFDLAYDGKGPPKLLEYNADTPTALYEAAVVQWYWLKDVKPDADQFNSIHEKLIEAWRGVLASLPPEAPGAFRALRGPARGSRDVGVPARHRPAGGPRRQADRRAADRLERPALHRPRRDADPGDEQALSLGMDGARGVRRPCAHRHHGLHRARLEDDPQQQDAAAAPVGGLPRPRQPAAGLRQPSMPTSAARL